MAAITADTETTRSTTPHTLRWHFPLPRPLTGIVLGNGVQGLLVWGDQKLCVTVGRAGFWDHRHRGESPLPSFSRVRESLERGDEAGLKSAFGLSEPPAGRPSRPQQLGAGRLELTLPDGLTPQVAELDMRHARLAVTCADADEQTHTLHIQQAVDTECAWLALPDALQGRCQMRVLSTWDFLRDTLEAVNVSAPQCFEEQRDAARIAGFVQALPEDEPLALAAADCGATITLATALGDATGAQVIELATDSAFQALGEHAQQWWRDFTDTGPRVSLPDDTLQKLFDYGDYRQGVLHPPRGLPCTLQGPVLEADKLPPWSADYHFNINAQMIYWPALHTGRWEHFAPLWNLLESWMPKLHERGQQFFGVQGAALLPHAVDDRCQVVGAFWTGTIDLACTAWMGQLAWLHYAYSGDTDVLSRIARPLLRGAFEGYWAMAEWVDDTSMPNGRRLSLPVTVSPEFRGTRIDAWGRDGSMQLAALRLSAELLQRIAEEMGQEKDARWAQSLAHCPHYTLAKACASQESGATDRTIALWEGLALPESHRHHSHLSAIYPFATLDPFDPAHRETVRQTLGRWMFMGRGRWSGWAHPWAATIHARCNNADGALGLLHEYAHYFTNIGDAPLHDADAPGASIIGPPLLEDASHRPEKMQMDAAMGALTAVCEMLVQSRRDAIHVLPSLPRRWRTLSFQRLWGEGGFAIDASVRRHRVTDVRVHSQRGNTLRICPNTGGQPHIESDQRGPLNVSPDEDGRVTLDTRSDETLTFRRID